MFMKRYEYILVPVDMIPDGIFKEYKLNDLVQNNKVLVKIRKGLYGLPQVGQMSYEKLVTHLKHGDYIPTGNTPALFKHCTKPISF